MAWSTPRTWTSGEVLTAANLNSYVRDQQQWLAGDGSNAKPSCRVYNSSNISHTTSGSQQALTFDSERWDVGSMHSTVSNTSRITIPAGAGGKYLFGAAAAFDSNATGLRSVSIVLNGASYLAGSQVATAGSGGYTLVSVTGYYALSAGDYLECYAYQSSGGALNVIAAAYYTPEFWAIWQAV